MTEGRAPYGAGDERRAHSTRHVVQAVELALPHYESFHGNMPIVQDLRDLLALAKALRQRLDDVEAALDGRFRAE